MRLYCLFKFIWIHLDVKIYELNNIRHSQHPMMIGKKLFTILGFVTWMTIMLVRN